MFYLRWLGSVAAGALLAWFYFSWFAKCYLRRHASDQMLEIEAWWVGFTVALCVYASTLYGIWAIPAAIVLLVSYYTAMHFGFCWFNKRGKRRLPVSLLLLRVFGFDKRTQ